MDKNNDIIERWEALYLEVKNFPHYRLPGFLECMENIIKIHNSPEYNNEYKLSIIFNLIYVMSNEYNKRREDFNSITSHLQREESNKFKEIFINKEAIPYIEKYYNILGYLIPIMDEALIFYKSIEEKYINKLYSYTNPEYNEITISQREIDQIAPHSQEYKHEILELVKSKYPFTNGRIIGIKSELYSKLKYPPSILVLIDEGDIEYNFTWMKKYYLLPGFLVHINYITVESTYKFPFSTFGILNKIL